MRHLDQKLGIFILFFYILWLDGILGTDSKSYEIIVSRKSNIHNHCRWAGPRQLKCDDLKSAFIRINYETRISGIKFMETRIRLKDPEYFISSRISLAVDKLSVGMRIDKTFNSNSKDLVMDPFSIKVKLHPHSDPIRIYIEPYISSLYVKLRVQNSAWLATLNIHLCLKNIYIEYSDTQDKATVLQYPSMVYAFKSFIYLTNTHIDCSSSHFHSRFLLGSTNNVSLRNVTIRNCRSSVWNDSTHSVHEKDEKMPLYVANINAQHNEYGGAISLMDSYLFAIKSKFMNNRANRRGGAIYMQNIGTYLPVYPTESRNLLLTNYHLHLIDCVFSNNIVNFESSNKTIEADKSRYEDETTIQGGSISYDYSATILMSSIKGIPLVNILKTQFLDNNVNILRLLNDVNSWSSESLLSNTQDSMITLPIWKTVFGGALAIGVALEASDYHFLINISQCTFNGNYVKSTVDESSLHGGAIGIYFRQNQLIAFVNITSTVFYSNMVYEESLKNTKMRNFQQRNIGTGGAVSCFSKPIGRSANSKRKYNLYFKDSLFERNVVSATRSFGGAISLHMLSDNLFLMSTESLMLTPKSIFSFVITNSRFYCNVAGFAPTSLLMDSSTCFNFSSSENTLIKQVLFDSFQPQQTRKGYGGAIYIFQAITSLSNVLFSENTASYRAGAFYQFTSDQPLRFGVGTNMYQNYAPDSASQLLYQGISDLQIEGINITEGLWPWSSSYTPPVAASIIAMSSFVSIEKSQMKCPSGSYLCRKIIPSPVSDPSLIYGTKNHSLPTSCCKCPGGTYSLDNSWQIGNDNAPNYRRYQAQCLPCPAGGACLRGGKLVERLPGYYGVVHRNETARSSLYLSFKECPPGFCNEVLEYDKCSDNRVDRLCSKCLSGYTELYGSEVYSPCVSMKTSKVCNKGLYQWKTWLRNISIFILCGIICLFIFNFRGYIDVLLFYYQMVYLLVPSVYIQQINLRFIVSYVLSISTFRFLSYSEYEKNKEEKLICLSTTTSLTAVDKIWMELLPFLALIICIFVIFLMHMGWKVIKSQATSRAFEALPSCCGNRSASLSFSQSFNQLRAAFLPASAPSQTEANFTARHDRISPVYPVENSYVATAPIDSRGLFCSESTRQITSIGVQDSTDEQLVDGRTTNPHLHETNGALNLSNARGLDSIDESRESLWSVQSSASYISTHSSSSTHNGSVDLVYCDFLDTASDTSSSLSSGVSIPLNPQLSDLRRSGNTRTPKLCSIVQSAAPVHPTLNKLGELHDLREVVQQSSITTFESLKGIRVRYSIAFLLSCWIGQLSVGLTAAKLTHCIKMGDVFVLFNAAYEECWQGYQYIAVFSLVLALLFPIFTILYGYHVFSRPLRFDQNPVLVKGIFFYTFSSCLKERKWYWLILQSLYQLVIAMLVIYGSPSSSIIPIIIALLTLLHFVLHMQHQPFLDTNLNHFQTVLCVIILLFSGFSRRFKSLYEIANQEQIKKDIWWIECGILYIPIVSLILIKLKGDSKKKNAETSLKQR